MTVSLPTQTDICNLALGHIAQRPITIITDTNSVQAVACNRVYITALRDCLCSNDWTFARTIAALALSATYDATPYGYLYAYVLPTQCEAIRSIFNAYTTDKILGEQYERAYDPVNNQQLILTNVEQAYARYTYIITDTTLFSADFVTAFSYALAVALAPILSRDDALEQKMVALFNNSISDAQRADSYEGNPPPNTQNDFVDARG